MSAQPKICALGLQGAFPCRGGFRPPSRFPLCSPCPPWWKFFGPSFLTLTSRPECRAACGTQRRDPGTTSTPRGSMGPPWTSIQKLFLCYP